MGRETGDSHKHQYLHCSLHSPTSSQLVLFALTCQGGLEVERVAILVLLAAATTSPRPTASSACGHALLVKGFQLLSPALLCLNLETRRQHSERGSI